LIRFESDGTATILANEGTVGPHVRIGQKWRDFPEAGLIRTVRRTGLPARVDDYRDIPGGSRFVSEGLTSAVGAPIHVHGELWGLIAIGSGSGPLPLDAEERLAEFTGLTATAVATAHSRAEALASQARIVAAGDESRRRIERDLHDGAQQQLVNLAMRLSTLSASPTALPVMCAQLGAAAEDLMSVVGDLREIARGIHPAILSDAGLEPALSALARRSTVPTDVRVRVDSRLTPPVEVGAYYFVAETLTNAVKHGHPTEVVVDAALVDRALHISVTDDGIGGADPLKGSGLVGLRDRVEALGGQLWICSPAGGGTRVHCVIPTVDCVGDRLTEPPDTSLRLAPGDGHRWCPEG
jgi:signal transduction histidine kinase